MGDVEGRPSNELQVWIVNTEITPEQSEGFYALLRELVAVTIAEELSYLEAVLIVPDSEIGNAANELIHTYVSDDFYYYRAPDSPGRGVALPIHSEGELGCYIVLGKSCVQDLSIEHYHPSETVRTVLEELLHVKLYIAQWQERGYVQPPVDNTCFDSLLVLCGKAHDEYIVLRWKAAIFATTALIEHEGFLSTGQIFYPNPLAPILDAAAVTLRRLVEQAASGARTVQEIWIELLQAVYGGVLEPLAREAGLRAGNIDALGQSAAPPAHLAWNATNSKFYRDFVRPYWEMMQSELERSFSNPGNTVAIQASMLDALLQMLQGLGITIERLEDGRCWVYCDTDASRLYEPEWWYED